MADDGAGRLAENILYFARALREAGLPVGPASVLDALAAVEAAHIGDRADFRAVLHAIFVKRHEQTLVFDQAFDLFWKRRGYMDKLMAAMSPIAEPRRSEPQKPKAGATRVADALSRQPPREQPQPQVELDARLTVSRRKCCALAISPR